MKNTRLLLHLALLAVLLAACAPGTSTVALREPEVVRASATPGPIPFGETPSVDLTATYMLELLSATPPSVVQPAATSRGPDLHATDPSTVSLASGGLQLVEFFRFT